jgi:nucleoside 2-deoxyribosyltransferase
MSNGASDGPRVYLAGPEVFLPNATDVGARKVAMCKVQGIVGLFPLDNELDLAGLAGEDQARAIARANEELMGAADALIANLTPFRGPSMDCGTAYEVGFMRALGRPVFGYTSSVADYRARVGEFRRAAGSWRDGDHADTAVEDFGLAENLMVDMGLRQSGHEAVRSGLGGGDITDLDAFAACLVAVAPLILSGWRGSRK